MKSSSRTRSAGRIRRHTRVRKRVSGISSRPRLSVFRSNKFIYAQLIDDESGTTLAAASDRGLADGSKTDRAVTVGNNLAAAARSKGITSVVSVSYTHLRAHETREDRGWGGGGG